MTVCRYFLKGCCLRGDRCRFEHPDPNSFYRKESSRKNNYNDYINRGSYNYSYNRRNYNAKENRSSYNRRNEYTHHEDRRRSNYDQYNQRYTSKNRYKSKRYGTGQANRYCQNKHPEDYRRPRDQQQNTDEFYSTRTPNIRVNFSKSVKDREFQRRTDHPVDLRMKDKSFVYVEWIKEDIKAWELGSQWPFTCYSPIQGRSIFPGFTDVSPEELRHEAYKARENNTAYSYLKSIENELQYLNGLRNQLKNPSVELISFIGDYCSRQNVTVESKVDGVFSRSNQSLDEDMLVDESLC